MSPQQAAERPSFNLTLFSSSTSQAGPHTIPAGYCTTLSEMVPRLLGVLLCLLLAVFHTTHAFLPRLQLKRLSIRQPECPLISEPEESAGIQSGSYGKALLESRKLVLKDILGLGPAGCILIITASMALVLLSYLTIYKPIYPIHFSSPRNCDFISSCISSVWAWYLKVSHEGRWEGCCWVEGAERKLTLALTRVVSSPLVSSPWILPTYCVHTYPL